MILEWLKEWACSRTQGLGTQVPWDNKFVIESLSDSTIYTAFYSVAYMLQGGSLDGSAGSPIGIKPEHLTHAAWDYVFLGKPFEAAKIPDISEETLSKMKNEFEYWYPMDMRVSGKDLIRNHLTFALYNHAAIWEEKMEQRMCRSYFCNGYLNLNGQKMSKSSGNFVTLKQSIEKFGVEASRIAIADAGDTLDDANFEESVANAAIIKLFVLEGWIKQHAVHDCDISKHNPEEYSLWDRIVDNELNLILQRVTKAYENMKFRDVIKSALNELLNLKENWLIALESAENKVSPNPHLMNRLI